MKVTWKMFFWIDFFFSMRLPKTQPSPYATCLAYNNTTSIINQKKPWAPNSNGRYSSRSANQIHASARKTPSFQQFHDSKADVNGLKQCYRRICNVCFPFYDIFFSNKHAVLLFQFSLLNNFLLLNTFIDISIYSQTQQNIYETLQALKNVFLNVLRLFILSSRYFFSQGWR